ncbi:MAG: 50S ribosomal protein L4 [Candidatus Curtissbacteria bacterium]
MAEAKVKKVIKVQTPKALAAKTKPEAAQTKTGSLTVNVFDLQGKSIERITLPKEIFGQTPNKNLLHQAIHVYQANAMPSTGHTKTRGEVRGGGAKPWKQKGTGNARAGSRRSPLWVGGGITFGPRAKDAKLTLPTKMKHSALISALSAKREQDGIKVIKNIEKAEAKTKIIANLILKLETKGKTLIVISGKNPNLKLATRNIKGISINTAQNLNAYEVLKSRNLILSTESITKFK